MMHTPTPLPHFLYHARYESDTAKELLLSKNAYGQLVVKTSKKSSLQINKSIKRKQVLALYYGDLIERYGRANVAIVAAWKKIDFFAMYHGDAKGNTLPLSTKHFTRLEKYCARLHSMKEYITIVLASISYTSNSPRKAALCLESRQEELSASRKRSASILINNKLDKAIKKYKKDSSSESQQLLSAAFRRYGSFFHLINDLEAKEIQDQLHQVCKVKNLDALFFSDCKTSPLSYASAKKVITLVDTLALLVEDSKRMIQSDNSEVLYHALKKLDITDKVRK